MNLKLNNAVYNTLGLSTTYNSFIIYIRQPHSIFNQNLNLLKKVTPNARNSPVFLLLLRHPINYQIPYFSILDHIVTFEKT